MGSYGPPVEVEVGRFWRMASNDAPKPSGLLASFTHEPMRFVSVQGKAYYFRDSSWCLTRPFLAPISFPESFGGGTVVDGGTGGTGGGNDVVVSGSAVEAKESMEATILRSHRAKRRGYAGGYDVRSLNGSKAHINVYFNHSLTRGIDLPRPATSCELKQHSIPIESHFKSLFMG